MNTMKLLTALSLLGFASMSLSCEILECGEGTTERNGECVAADGTIPEADSCGEGTHYDETLLACVPDYEATICGDNTQAVPNAEGVLVCEGTGGGGCSLPCPVPIANNNTICGQLVNAEDNEPISETDLDGTVCSFDPDNPPGNNSPCWLEVTFYDALSFAQNPTGTPPLPTDSTTINNCGRFAGVNIPTPALGFLAVGVDDVGSGEGDNIADDWILSGVAFPAAPGDRRTDQKTFVVKVSTDQKWTNSAGTPFGATTFADKGVFFPIFMNGDTPVPGVKITRDPGVPVPADDYYFNDTVATIRASVDTSLSETGINGAGLMVNSDLVDHGGEGGLPAECAWPEDLAKSIPGVVFANEREAELIATGEPCSE